MPLIERDERRGEDKKERKREKKKDMSRLRIISLAHRATWSDVVSQDAIEKMCSLKEGSSSFYLIK